MSDHEAHCYSNSNNYGIPEPAGRVPSASELRELKFDWISESEWEQDWISDAE
jgi:hypothetical protein